jgi:hypothetical protein
MKASSALTPVGNASRLIRGALDPRRDTQYVPATGGW